MTSGVFTYMNREIPFREGETVAAALAAQGIYAYGPDAGRRETRYFCGIGACQCCLVSINGKTGEACLTPARAGLAIYPAGDFPSGDSHV